jgi:RsiW-degrading membrane proteinase PrsW (M82 family)
MAPAHPPVPSVQPRRPGLVSDLLRLGGRIRRSSLLSWPVLLFLVLICVPPVVLVILGASPNANTFDHVAWIFAAYFGIAWLLLLGVIIRPGQVTRQMLVLVTAIALATQVPLAITLESDLHASTTGLGPSIYAVGLPEELAKAIPVSTSLFAVLIGPVRYFTLDFVWRFLADPISHACWSGLTGYFIRLAVTRRHQWYAVAWTGLAAAAVLHGLNDWGRVNGPPPVDRGRRGQRHLAPQPRQDQIRKHPATC